MDITLEGLLQQLAHSLSTFVQAALVRLLCVKHSVKHYNKRGDKIYIFFEKEKRHTALAACAYLRI
jgi:hypothetical protein